MSSTQTSQMNTIINRPMIFNKSVPTDVPAVIRQAKTGELRQRRPLNNDIKDLVNEVVKVRRSRRMRSNVLTINRGVGGGDSDSREGLTSQVTDEGCEQPIMMKAVPNYFPIETKRFSDFPTYNQDPPTFAPDTPTLLPPSVLAHSKT